MTGNFKKLIESVQVDIVLTDMLYQWANTPTGTTAVDKRWIPDHGLIKKNIMVRYKLDKEGEGVISKNSKNSLKMQVLTSILDILMLHCLSMSISASIQF